MESPKIQQEYGLLTRLLKMPNQLIKPFALLSGTRGKAPRAPYQDR